MPHYTVAPTPWERDWVSDREEALGRGEVGEGALAEAPSKPSKPSKPIKKWWEDTQFDPMKTYPRGILQEILLLVNSLSFSVKFFPSCDAVGFAIRHRYCEGPGHGEIEMCDREEAKDSWSLDEVSSGQNGDMDKDIEKIKEILEWQEEDIRKMEIDANELIICLPENEEMDEWLNIHTFTEEEEKFFENEITSMNLHHLRASAGPPTGEYYMKVLYDSKTGLPDKDKQGACWRYEEWCPVMGRLDLMRIPENYGSFSTFNPNYRPFGIQWPQDIREKTEDECGERRFSGLQSCGRWMEFTMDNEGRFVANGVVKKIMPFRINVPDWGCLVETDYGNCIVPEHLVTKNNLTVGKRVKILCKDNDIPKGSQAPIRCSKVITSGPEAHKDFAPCGWY